MAKDEMKLYNELKNLRGKDRYWDKGMQAELMEKAFPKDVSALVLGMSYVASEFYGYMLMQIGEKFGWDKVDSVSKAVFHQLGKEKTKAAIDGGLDLPRDTRALALVLASTVYSSNPEFNFEVKEYAPEQTVIRIFGTSRYSRIAKKVGIEKHLSWPVLVPFFEGIADQIGIECECNTETNVMGEDGKCDYLARFTLSGRKYGDD